MQYLQIMNIQKYIMEKTNKMPETNKSNMNSMVVLIKYYN